MASVSWRLREELEVVQPRQAALMNDGGAARLQADGDARAAELRANMPDCRAVGGMVHLDDARRQTFAGDAGENGGQHVFVWNAADGAGERGAKGRPDRHNHFAALPARAGPIGASCATGAPSCSAMKSRGERRWRIC